MIGMIREHVRRVVTPSSLRAREGARIGRTAHSPTTARDIYSKAGVYPSLCFIYKGDNMDKLCPQSGTGLKMDKVDKNCPHCGALPLFRPFSSGIKPGIKPGASSGIKPGINPPLFISMPKAAPILAHLFYEHAC
jgi:hypothetical protein